MGHNNGGSASRTFLPMERPNQQGLRNLAKMGVLYTASQTRTDRTGKAGHQVV